MFPVRRSVSEIGYYNRKERYVSLSIFETTHEHEYIATKRKERKGMENQRDTRER